MNSVVSLWSSSICNLALTIWATFSRKRQTRQICKETWSDRAYLQQCPLITASTEISPLHRNGMWWSASLSCLTSTTDVFLNFEVGNIWSGKKLSSWRVLDSLGWLEGSSIAFNNISWHTFNVSFLKIDWMEQAIGWSLCMDDWLISRKTIEERECNAMVV